MALSYPYPVASFADKLKIASVEWDIQRNDELSGTGDGRVWPAELAPPLWTAEVRLTLDENDSAKQIAALVRKLYGAQETFWLYDPLSRYPQSDPTGAILGASTVEVKSVALSRKALALEGLPSGYTLTVGDKLQITFGGTAAYNFFGEVSETVSADSSGETAEFEVFPHLPAGIDAGDMVTLAKPACKMFIVPGSVRAGTASVFTEGAGFRAMERRP